MPRKQRYLGHQVRLDKRLDRRLLSQFANFEPDLIAGPDGKETNLRKLLRYLSGKTLRTEPAASGGGYAQQIPRDGGLEAHEARKFAQLEAPSEPDAP
jgi:hypothetical protein